MLQSKSLRNNTELIIDCSGPQFLAGSPGIIEEVLKRPQWNEDCFNFTIRSASFTRN